MFWKIGIFYVLGSGLGCRGVMEKFCDGCNIHCRHILSYVVWVESVVEGLELLDNGVSDYL